VIPDCIVVGAGMAGLTAAAVLRSAGCHVTVVDKGRGYGGRLATRRIGESRFDHGAQYFTARHPAFAARVADWEREGVVRRWFEEDGEPRFVAPGGMNSLARHLAQGLDVRLSTAVTGVHRTASGWRVECEDANPLEAAGLIVTAPAEQALRLVHPFLTEDESSQLSSIEYQPCFALMALYSGHHDLPGPGFVRLKDGPVSWVADNRTKWASSGPSALTVHASPEFTQSHYESPQPEVAAALLAAVRSLVPADPVEWQLHRWRYALVQRQSALPCLCVADSLVVAGDGFGGPRVEGAFLSGLAAGEALTKS
jgi:predicted NAD/FAD-dependent oxidoreductase